MKLTKVKSNEHGGVVYYFLEQKAPDGRVARFRLAVSEQLDMLKIVARRIVADDLRRGRAELRALIAREGGSDKTENKGDTHAI